jgi:signal transduction histidine kinase
LQHYRQGHFELSAQAVESILSFNNNVVFSENTGGLKEVPYRQIFKNDEIQSVTSIGIYHQKDPLGVIISAFFDPGVSIQNADFELLKGLADQAAVAITNANLLKQVQIGREYQRKLAKGIIRIQEEERRHLARELHDHLGQILTGLQFMLENSKHQSGEQQKASMSEIQKTVGEVIEQVREMSLDLRPSMLDDMGLLPTLQWHVERFKTQTGIHINFSCSEVEGRFPPEIETAAYRIIQEALTNVARHAEVKEVFVGLLVQDDTLWIEILDQGRGFNPIASLKRSTSGLSGMHERASLVGGYLVIESYPNQGTQLVVALPLTNKHLERRKIDRHNRLTGR